MVEQILIPTSTDIVVHIPDEYLGKRVRVRVDEEIAPAEISDDEHEQRMEWLQNALKNSLVDTSGFRFDRDEANNYE